MLRELTFSYTHISKTNFPAYAVVSRHTVASIRSIRFPVYHTADSVLRIKISLPFPV